MHEKQPKCDECMPQIYPENKEVLNVYMQVRNQHIMSFSGPVDLNFSSVEFYMNMIGVEDKKDVFMRVLKLYRKLLYDELKEHDLRKRL